MKGINPTFDSTKSEYLDISVTSPSRKLDQVKSESKNQAASIIKKENEGSYGYYMKNATSFWPAICIILVCLGSEASFRLSDLFLVNITSSTGSFIGYNRIEIVQIYSSLLATGFILTLAGIACFCHAFQVASKRLHSKLLSQLTHAPIQFFDSHLIGEILNRFSRDLGHIDEFIPAIFGEFVAIRSVTILGFIMTTLLIDHHNALPCSLIFGFIILIGLIYIPKVVRLRHLDNQTRNDIFSHLSSSVSGLSTIRALGAQNKWIEQFSNLQNTNTRASFAYISGCSLVGTLFHLCTMIIITTIIALNITIGFEEVWKLNSTGIFIGRLFYIQVVFQWWSRLLLLLGGYMTSVENINSYSHVEHEPKYVCGFQTAGPDQNQLDRPKSWISPPRIKFNHVYLQYPHCCKPTLDGISLVIKPGERIGVVGRTGSGKSSLITALLGLYPFRGTITINGRNTKAMSLSELREQISVIPQEPILFAGTLRVNLDPNAARSDAELWSSLEAVQIRSFFEKSPKKLDFEIHERGTNLSLGQRQLTCLARVLLRSTNIVILDEPTARIDTQTEKLIQDVFSKQFKNCTLIIIADRLTSALNSDRVVVLEEGQVREFAAPSQLVQDPLSRLKRFFDEYSLQQTSQLREPSTNRSAIVNLTEK